MRNLVEGRIYCLTQKRKEIKEMGKVGTVKENEGVGVDIMVQQNGNGGSNGYTKRRMEKEREGNFHILWTITHLQNPSDGQRHSLPRTKTSWPGLFILLLFLFNIFCHTSPSIIATFTTDAP